MDTQKTTFDYRKLSSKAKEEVRIASVKRVIQKKESLKKVVEDYGYNERNIYRWLAIYKKSGYKGLQTKKKKGRPRKLTPTQITRLKKYLGKDPRQLRLPFALWTVKMVQTIIKEKFNISYRISGVHNLLQKFGYSYQKPLLRAIEQDPEGVKQWEKEEYPKIKKEAKKENRAIYFADESGFQATHNKMKTWGKKGVRPIVTTTGRRFSKGVISALSPQGKLHFMQYDGGMNQELFITFLKRLEKTEERKITLILDGLPTHKGKKVRDYVATREGRIKLYFLPGYFLLS